MNLIAITYLYFNDLRTFSAQTTDSKQPHNKHFWVFYSTTTPKMRSSALEGHPATSCRRSGMISAILTLSFGSCSDFRARGSIVLEFDNALSGLVLGPYNRWSGRLRGSTPAEIRTVIENDCRVAHIYGAIFPIVWRVFHRWPRIFAPVEKLEYYWPLNRLAFRIFCELQKL
jgi:hypothetical protein